MEGWFAMARPGLWNLEEYKFCTGKGAALISGSRESWMLPIKDPKFGAGGRAQQAE